MQDDYNKYCDFFSKRLKSAIGDDTQLIVSKRLNCSQQLVSKYLKGDVPEAFIFLSKLALEYKIDLNWLLTGQITGSIEKLYYRHVKFTERLVGYVNDFFIDVCVERDRIQKLLDSDQSLTEDQKKEYAEKLVKLKIETNKTISDLKLLQEFPWGGNSYNDDPIKTYEAFILGGENPTELK
jgi:transcriptional regulator with XRE-family HTH domain